MFLNDRAACGSGEQRFLSAFSILPDTLPKARAWPRAETGRELAFILPSQQLTSWNAGAGQAPGEFIEAPWWGEKQAGVHCMPGPNSSPWSPCHQPPSWSSGVPVIFRDGRHWQSGWGVFILYFLPSHPFTGIHGGKLGAVPTTLLSGLQTGNAKCFSTGWEEGLRTQTALFESEPCRVTLAGYSEPLFPHL